MTRTLPVEIDRAAFDAILAGFVGPHRQTPPRHAALKHRGRAYYDWAREGVEIPRPPRAIELYALSLREWRPPDAVVDVHCSKGTYVRVLAEDLGAAAGTCAHLAALRRTATGGFDIGDAVTLDDLEAMAPEERLARLRPVDVLVADMPRVDVAPGDVERFRHGVAVPSSGEGSGRCVVYGAGELLGMADVDEGVARPARLLAEPPREPVSS